MSLVTGVETTVQYGSVTLGLVKTNLFSQEPILVDDVQYLYTRFRISVQCVFNSATMTGLGDNPAQINTNIRLAMMRERQVLRILVGGVPLLEVASPDNKAGPFPKSCNVNQIIGTQTFIVSWECEAFLHDCTPVPSVLSNRWDMTLTYDENFFCTRNTNGLLIVRPNGSTNPPRKDEFMSLMMPPLPTGWIRTRMSFVEARDGLSMAYQIEDKEVEFVPPVPATKSTIDYGERVELGAPFIIAELTIELSGRRGCPRLDLLQTAFEVAASRIDFVKDIVKLSQINEFNQTGSEPRIRLHVVADKLPAQLEAQADPCKVLLDKTKFGIQIPGTQDLDAWDLDDRTALVRTVVAAWKEPCAAVSAVGPVNLASVDAPAGTTVSPTIEYSQGELDALAAAKWSDEQFGTTGSNGQRAIYSEYNQDVTYRMKQHKLVLPVASDTHASPGETALKDFDFRSQVIRLFQPEIEKIIKWRGQRNDKWPSAPSPEIKKDKHHLTGFSVTPETPPLLPNGTSFDYVLKGEMTVAIEEGINPMEDSLDAGELPYANGSERQVPPEVWKDTIVWDDTVDGGEGEES